MNRKLALIINLTTLTLLLPVKAGLAALGAHEHGSATLNIAVDDKVLFIEFESPAANIVGFEHKPRTTAQRNAIEAAVNVLENFGRVFQLPDAAACTIDKASVRQTSETDGHAEFHAEYALACERIDQLSSIDVLLFDRFPDIEHIDVQAIFPDNQIAIELHAGQSAIKLK